MLEAKLPSQGPDRLKGSMEAIPNVEQLHQLAKESQLSSVSARCNTHLKIACEMIGPPPPQKISGKCLPLVFFVQAWPDATAQSLQDPVEPA